MLSEIMDKFSYISGAYMAAQRLGLTKVAAIGAKTILPAATDAAQNVGKAVGKGTGAQSSASKALPESMLEESPLIQHAAILGKRSPVERRGSDDVRNHLLNQVSRSEFGKVKPFIETADSAGTVPPPRAKPQEPSLPGPSAVPSV